MSKKALKRIEENNLTKAPVLNLAVCAIKELPKDIFFRCNWIKELSLSWNQIEDISFLSSITSITSLDLSWNQIEDYSLLSSLTSLTSLDLGRNQIVDYSFLSSLTSLTSLDLGRNQIIYFDFSLLRSLLNLSDLFLINNPIQNIQAAVYNQDECLEDIKTYIRDLKIAALRQYEAKLLITGNGRVGKTCLVKRLIDNTFNKDEPSTHAIQLRQWPLPQLAKDTALENILINIWDFGGQEIYHATHRFFMRSQALFILAWDSETENLPKQPDSIHHNISYNNYRLPYWLSYIKTQSNNNPVITVQTKACTDDIEEQSDYTGLTAEQKKEYNVFRTLAVDSGKNHHENGFDELQTSIEKLIRRQIKNNCTDIPAQWYRVRQQIAALQESGVKQLSIEDFETICKEEGLDESSVDTLLRFLHNCGVFFYKHGLFNNQIVINQKWAIEAVYILFNRQGIFAELHGSGIFTGKDIKRKEVWQDYAEEEQELFISFMKQCEVCFEIEEQNSRNKPFSERRYIAPQLLPDEKSKLLQEIIRSQFGKSDGIYFRYRHRVLHAAIIQRFIVRTGFMADPDFMWKTGIYINLPEGIAVIEANADQNEIVIHIKDAGNTALLSKIRNELKEIQQDEEGIEESVSIDGKIFVSLTALKNHRIENKELTAEDGTWINFDNYRIFLNEDDKIRFDKNKPIQPMQPVVDDRPAIYFSYAWQDITNDNREKFVGELYESLKEDISKKYKLRRDKEDVGYKDSISDFMKEIGSGNLVVVAISKKYLESEYCMYELHELYLKSQSDLEEMRKKIFLVLVEKIDLTDPLILDQYFDFWQKKEESWEVLVQKRASRISPEQQIRYNKIKKIASDLGRFLDFIADMNTRTIELLEKDDFKEMKAAIQKRMDELNVV